MLTALCLMRISHDLLFIHRQKHRHHLYLIHTQKKRENLVVKQDFLFLIMVMSAQDKLLHRNL